MVAHRDQPGLLVGTRVHCPLLVGVGDGEMFLASAATAFLRDTRRLLLIEDGEIVAITAEGARVHEREDGATRSTRDVITVAGTTRRPRSRGYETFMLKEINEQPEAVSETIGDRVRHGKLLLESLGPTDGRPATCGGSSSSRAGPSYHAGLVGRFVIEEWAHIPCDREVASEWRYRNPVLSKHTLVVAISQSGETADTLACDPARPRDGRANHRDHEHHGLADHPRGRRRALHAHRLEMGVAATKTFTAQLALVSLIALKLAEVKKTIAAGGDRVHPRPAVRAAAEDAGLPRREPPVEEIAQRLTTSRSSSTSGGTSGCRCARGRAEAQGDRVHPDRGVRGG